MKTYHRGTLPTHRLRRIKLAFECAKRMAHHVSGAACVQHNVVIVGFDPRDGTDWHEELTTTLHHHKPFTPALPGASRLANSTMSPVIATRCRSQRYPPIAHRPIFRP